MDFFLKLKATTKGPNSLGNTNENNIAAKYRGIDPSFIGRLDINVCGTSDPGTSALITPFCKTDGLFFDGTNEPEDFKFRYDRDIYKYLEDEDCYNINPPTDSVEDYFNFTLNNKSIMKSFKYEERDNLNNLYTIDINIDEEDI